MRTAAVAGAAGCSVQQVRDLEHAGVIPPAGRTANGYREFDERHVAAILGYRSLATAVGPVVARHVMRELWAAPFPQAVAAISALHVGLTREREEALAARTALLAIRAERDGAGSSADVGGGMTIAELGAALGVRSSALRFWEKEGLVLPERVTSRGARHYPPLAVRDARIVVALRAAGYRIPEVREAVAALRSVGDTARPLQALDARLESIAARTVALMDAGTDLARLLRSRF
ncbi:MerR family transcriptional regulator [Leifsonia sp. NPDC080035]|uniref:MerR family transcriptional regulator n=1 Tax=Leifsonia sp. NPDC080035 TaxID=3143936 RepID=A0AAU7GF51_9MICO